MIEDITYDSLIFVFETPDGIPGDVILGYSYDGDNFDFTSGSEVSFVFIN